MPKKQAFIDKSGVKFVENFQKNQKIKKFPSRTEIRYLTAFMQKSRRVSLARLFLSRRTLWVLDEPLTALDTKASQHVAQAVDRHLDDGGIAVITTHQDMALASPLQTELPAPSWPLSPNYFRYNFGAYGACCGNWAVGSLCYLAA